MMEFSLSLTRSADLFKHLLVPLDGSLCAERAVPLAARIARVCEGSLLLLRVVALGDTLEVGIPGLTLFQQKVLDQELLRARAYLGGLMKRVRCLDGIAMRTAVFAGDPAVSILEVARQQNNDLIVLCSHGLTGITRWALGSIAQKVVRQSPVPVLLVPEGAADLREKQPWTRPVRVLVALDGSPWAEATLKPAAQLCAVLSAPLPGELHLVRVLPFSTAAEHAQQGHTARAKQAAIQETQVYLHKIQHQCLETVQGNRPCQITTSFAISTDVAGTLLAIAEMGQGESTSIPCDIIALATHGRSGLTRWVLGSIAERLIEASHLPVLLIRPQQFQLPHA